MTLQARSSSTTSTIDPRRSSGVGAIGLGGVNGMAPCGSISVAMATSARRNSPSHRVPTVLPRPLAAPRGPPNRKGGPSVRALVHELGTCVTEADIVQVLYRGLQAKFGYGAINLQVLEREGWYHSLAADAGGLQDVRGRPGR